MTEMDQKVEAVKQWLELQFSGAQVETGEIFERETHLFRVQRAKGRPPELEISREVLEELQRMDVFIALLSKSFKSSDWAPQELGFAVARPEAPIIPLSLDGTVPFGFISHIQGKRLSDPLTDSLFLGPLQRHYPRQLTPALIERLSGARSFRGAEALMEPLRPMFRDFTASEIDQFAEACIRNSQIWDASLCAATYIPEFIQLHRHRMRAARLHVLQHQIEERQWHDDAHEA